MSISNNVCSSKPRYQIDIVTDTLFYTIVKVVLSGETKDPTLLLASDSLVGATIQSAIAQFGGGLPNLPDIQCISGKTKKGGCRCCDWSNGQWCRECQKYSGAGRCRLGNKIVPSLGNISSGAGGSVTSSPDIITQNDLVTFLPPQMTNRFSSPTNPSNINSQSLPLLYGMSPSCGNVSYALVGTDNFQDLLKLINNNTDKTLLGNWKQECGCNFRYYYNTILTKVITLQDTTVSVLDLVGEISRIPQNGSVGKWLPTCGNNYCFSVSGNVEWHISLGQPASTISDLLEALNIIPIENQIGSWTSCPTDNCSFIFRFQMRSTGINAEFSSIELALTDMNWRLSSLKNGVFTYVKDKLLLRITPCQTQVNVVANQESFNTFFKEILEPYSWKYSMTRDWLQSLTAMKISERKAGVFDLVGNRETIESIGKHIPDGWLSSDIESEVLETIILNIPKETVIANLENQGWDSFTSITDCTSLSKDNLVAQINDNAQGSELFGNTETLENIIKEIIIPNNWEYQDKELAKTETIQIIQTQTDNLVQILGNDKILQQFHEEFPNLFNKPETKKLELILVHGPYAEILNYLGKKWNVIYTNENSSSFAHPNIPTFTLEVFGGQQTTTIWGFTDSINYFKESIRLEDKWYSYDNDVATDQVATIFKLENTALPYSQYISTYQVIAPAETVETMCQQISDPTRCKVETNLKYSSLTAEKETASLLDILKNHDYGVGASGWKPDGQNQLGCGNENMFRYYELGSGGQETATPFFIYIFTIPSNSDNLVSYTKIEGLEFVLNRLIKPILKLYRINYISAGDKPIAPQPVSLTVGKVVGLTGNIKKLPNCEAPTRIAITNINWSLNSNTNSDNNKPFVELLWETDGDDIDGTTINNCCDVTGQTAFIFSGSGNYGLGSLNTNNGNTLLDGGGQPGIPNNAYPNPTGNILFKTSGGVFGTFTIKFYKYSGYYNYINFFDNDANQLQAAIQANELLRRDIIRETKRQNEEAILLPMLLEMERNSRTLIRPNPNTNVRIIHTVNGDIEIIIPRSVIDPNRPVNTDGNSIVTYNNNDNRFFSTCNDTTACIINTIEVQIQLRNLLNSYLALTGNNSSIAIIKEEIIPPGDVIQINLKLTIDVASSGLNYTQQWLEYAYGLQARLEALNTEFDQYTADYNNLRDIISFNITTYISAYVINQDNNTLTASQYSNIVQAQVDEYYLTRIISELDILLRDNLKPGPLAVPDRSLAIQQLGLLNSANTSKWFDTQVRRLLYGSEAPIPINLPTREKPYYTFQDGTPISGFLHNAFATGYTIPVNPLPEIAIPNDITQQVPRATQNYSVPGTTPPFLYGNTQVRTTTNNFSNPNQVRHQINSQIDTLQFQTFLRDIGM